jgi:nucleoside 2-deoxyribosyltransferase
MKPLKPTKIYFAGPLFSESERNWIKTTIPRIQALADEQDTPIKIIWPWELFSPGELDGFGDQAMHEVFKRCREHSNSTNMMIALLDGALVDDGTAWEIGYFYAIRKKGDAIIGVRTDGRRGGEFANASVNAMIECSCDRIAKSTDELMGILRETWITKKGMEKAGHSGEEGRWR